MAKNAYSPTDNNKGWGMGIAAKGILLLCGLALAPVTVYALPPPPDPRDVAVQNAMQGLTFLTGAWQSVEDTERGHGQLDAAMDWQWGTITIEDNYRRRFLILAFDTASHKLKLFAPKAGGFEVVDVRRPDADTLQWVTHPDGPAIQTTITRTGGLLHKVDALLDVDGQFKPELDLSFRKVGSGYLKFNIVPPRIYVDPPPNLQQR